jgi:hypothetical protein
MTTRAADDFEAIRANLPRVRGECRPADLIKRLQPSPTVPGGIWRYYAL